jgi:YD repeat-containing protein
VDWTYKSGANGSATSLLSTYANGSDAKHNYDYDANGNITKIWRGSSTFENADEKFSYEYDSMNQLVRENLYYGENNSANSTYTYAYDSYGNMLGKYHLHTQRVQLRTSSGSPLRNISTPIRNGAIC